MICKAKLIWALGRMPVVGYILRWYAHRFLEGSIVRIKSGHAAGFKWKRCHRYVNGYWIGQYELPMQKAIVRELAAGDTFFDIGANAGFFSLVAAKIVGYNGKVLAFEPLPDNAEYISEQFTLNDLEYCHVIRDAISAYVGTALFSYDKPGTSTAHVGNSKGGEKSIQVKLNTLDNVTRTWGIPKLVKMDIEGAEVAALEGASNLLQKGCVTFLIELHGPDCEVGVREILSNNGYEFFNLEGARLDINKQLPPHILAKKTNEDI